MRHCKDTGEDKNNDGNRKDVGMGYLQEFAIGFREGKPFLQPCPVFFFRYWSVLIFLFVTTVIADGLLRRKPSPLIIIQKTQTNGNCYDGQEKGKKNLITDWKRPHAI